MPLQNVQPAAGLITKAPIGVDLGLISLMATSEGEKVEHPHFLSKAEKRLKRLQRAMSRREKGSKNRSRARQRGASQHSCIRRQRQDFNHKLSARLVRDHGFIAFFECSGCLRLIDRDTNASQVMLKRGLAIAGLISAKAGQDMPELKPLSTRPLLLQSTGGASQVEEAGTTSPERAGSPRF